MRAVLALAVTCVAAPLHAQSFKVGSFTKSTVTAVAVQNQTSASVAAALTVSTAVFDPGSNANRLLVVGISSDGTLTSLSVTYGAAALTLVPGSSISNGTTHTELWSLANPSSTPAIVTATWTTTNRTAVMGVVAFNNVDQTTPLSGAVTNTGTSTTPSVTIASRTGDMVLAAAGKLTNLATEPVTSVGTTLRGRTRKAAAPPRPARQASRARGRRRRTRPSGRRRASTCASPRRSRSRTASASCRRR